MNLSLCDQVYLIKERGRFMSTGLFFTYKIVYSHKLKALQESCNEAYNGNALANSFTNASRLCKSNNTVSCRGSLRFFCRLPVLMKTFILIFNSETAGTRKNAATSDYEIQILKYLYRLRIKAIFHRSELGIPWIGMQLFGRKPDIKPKY